MWAQGEIFRREHGPTPIPAYPVYSLKLKDLNERALQLSNQEVYDNRTNKSNEDTKVDNVLRILQKVDTMKLDDHTDENKNSEYNDVPSTLPASSNIIRVHFIDSCNT